MALKEKQLFQSIDKVQTAIARFKEFEPAEGYFLAFSGGKDSVVIKALADLAGVKYDAHYSVTTIDPPELVHFIRDHYPDVIWDRPAQAFLTRLIDRGFPMRQHRWCCEEYKEQGGAGRFVVTGVRSAESVRRRGRKMVDVCHRGRGGAKRMLNVIVDWTQNDVWEFIRTRDLPYCKLYDQGFSRLGCLFCPAAYYLQREYEAERYPGYVKQFRRAFRALHERFKKDRPETAARWPDGDAMFDWWLSGKSSSKRDATQQVLFE